VKVDNGDARMTRHDRAHTREEKEKTMQKMMIFRALERGINTCRSFCTTSMVWYDQLKHVAEGRQTGTSVSEGRARSRLIHEEGEL
jgi:hypothetical protein